MNDLRITHWRQGSPPVAATTDDGSNGVKCVEVAAGADPAAVWRALREICGPSLSRAMVEDLLEPDELPRVVEHARDSEAAVRSLSGFGARAAAPAEEDVGGCGSLQFDLVEFLAGDGWLVCCCHGGRSYLRGEDPRSTTPTGCDRLMRSAVRRWVDSGGSTAGDLGSTLLHELSCSFVPAAREMTAWLEHWELDCYRERPRRETLFELRKLVAEFRLRLNALNAPRDEVHRAWFDGLTTTELAERADAQIDKTLRVLDRLGDMLRAGFELVQSHAAATHLALAQEQRRASAKLERRIELVTVLFLVPTLIAGIWGENSWVPGQQHPWGFMLSLALMALFSSVVLVFLRRASTARQQREAAPVR